jgi:hypothetical protein
VGFGILSAGLAALEQPLEPLGEDHAALGALALQPEHPGEAGGQALAAPYRPEVFRERTTAPIGSPVAGWDRASWQPIKHAIAPIVAATPA